MKIRTLLHADLADVLRIQRQCYSEDILESSASFAAKLNAHSGYSFVATQNNAPVGYIVALPWVFGEVLELDGSEFSIPSEADGVCIHDLAISPKARKLGAAELLIDSVLDAAKNNGFRRISLVAIQGASSYWARHGFEVVQLSTEAQHKLNPYGDDVQYMVRYLT